MASSQVVIPMLIGKLREVMLERAVLGRELQDQLSQFVEQLEQMLYDSFDGLVDEAGDGHLQQECKNLMICAREAEDISDAILVESSMPPKSLKGLFVNMVGDLIGYGDSRAKARKLLEKLVELSWHYNKMKGLLSHAERGPKVSEVSTGSGRPEYPMKRPTTTTTTASNYEKLSLIGREGDAKGLVDMLKNTKSFQLISVTGEEGIGKTALVRSVYDLPSIDSLFDCRAWISISNGMSLRRILVELIKQSPAKVLKDLYHLDLKELCWLLHRLLTNSRYLIVLDDLKDFLLDKNSLLSCFPDDLNGSRVIVTSREVLPSLPKGDHWAPCLVLHPLDRESSYKLLRQTHWMDDEGVAGKILNKCKESPRKLLLCRGLVAASYARSGTVTECLIDSLEQDWNIQAGMSLSFRKLPHWVKPCLLYLCLFPSGAEIPTRRVFQLWYAEGLACRNSPTTAKACLQELLNWNMVQLVTRREADNSPKTFCLQGYWHNYLSEFSTGFGLLDTDGEDNRILRRSSPTTVSPWLARYWGDGTSLPPQDSKTASRIRSYISFKTDKSGKRSREVKLLLRPLKGMRDSALLRVLDLEGVYKPKLPDQFGDLLPNLRYLGLRWTILDSLPKSTMNLSKLETLDLKHTDVTKLPGSILSLKSLRHLYLNEVSFDSYTPTKNFGSNMETLWGLSVLKGSRMLKALGKFKGLRKLGLTCHSADVWEVTENISTLTMLESLRLRSRDILGQPGNFKLGPHMKMLFSLSKLYMLGRLDGFGASLGCLPRNLRVLTLSMSELQYDPMSSLGQLQHLVRLSLLGRSYVGKIITFPESSFPSLRELQLWKIEKLREIRMEEGSMKSLEELEIRGCKKMRKINGLENATKLRHVKLTELAIQFAQHLKKRRKELLTTSRKTTWIITTKELVDEYEHFSFLSGYPGFMRHEFYDLFLGSPSPEVEEEPEPVPLPELDSIVD